MNLDWKGILTTVAGILVVVLQIINVVLSSGIETELGQKTAGLVKLVQQTIDLDTQVQKRTQEAQNAHAAIKAKLEEMMSSPTPHQ